jgi:hypothetical protein
MAVADEEFSFPRGGGDSLAAVERKRLRLEAAAEAAADFAAEEKQSAGVPSKRRKKGSAPGADEVRTLTSYPAFSSSPVQTSCTRNTVPVRPSFPSAVLHL